MARDRTVSCVPDGLVFQNPRQAANINHVRPSCNIYYELPSDLRATSIQADANNLAAFNRDELNDMCGLERWLRRGIVVGSHGDGDGANTAVQLVMAMDLTTVYAEEFVMGEEGG